MRQKLVLILIHILKTFPDKIITWIRVGANDKTDWLEFITIDL